MRSSSSRARRPHATWLQGLADNGTVYDGNNVVLESVNSGEVDAGIIYHYYWYRDQMESGENSDDSELHFFGNQDPGAFVSVSGAGVLASSDKQDDAQQFVNFLASTRASRRSPTPTPWSTRSTRTCRSTRRSSLSPSWTRRRSTCRGSTARRSIELMQDVGLL